MTGLFVCRHLVRVEPLASASTEEVAALLGPAVEALLARPQSRSENIGSPRRPIHEFQPAQTLARLRVRVARHLPCDWSGGPGMCFTIHVSAFRSTKGGLICRLYASGEGFPSKPTYMALASSPITGKTATCEFHEVAPGTYAVALFHDENGNGKLDTNFLGIPNEGVGVSNNKKPRFGPPSWNDAKFNLDRDATIQVMLRY